MKAVLSFLLLGFLFSTCTKDGKNITVQGRVLNPVTGEGIPNVEIRLLKVTSGSPGTSGGYKEVAKTYSDANGNYELNHTSWFSRLVACYTDHEVYYDLGWVENGVLLNSYNEKVNLGKYTYLDFWTVSHGQLKINIHNVNCEGPTDQIILERNYRHDPNNPIYYPVTLTGCYTADGVAAKVPMGYYDLKWTVTKPSSGTQVFTDDVYVPDGGIGEYTINY